MKKINKKIGPIAKNLNLETQKMDNATIIASQHCHEGKLLFKFECPVCPHAKRDWMRTTLLFHARKHIKKHLLNKRGAQDV